MSNDIRTGWEQAAKAIAERGQAWSKRGDYALAMECSQLFSMLHDLKPVAAPAAPSGELPPLPAEHYEMHGKWFYDERLMREYARAAIAHQPPKAALTEKAIDAIWESLPGLTIIKDKPQDQWNRLLRHEFAEAIIAASAPNKQLVEALKEACDLIRLEIADGTHTEEYRRGIAALDSAGVPLKGE